MVRMDDQTLHLRRCTTETLEALFPSSHMAGSASLVYNALKQLDARLRLLESRQEPISEEQAAELWPDDPDYRPKEGTADGA